MSIKVEMSFCMKKSDSNRFSEFVDIINQNGWELSGINETGWDYGPVSSCSFVKCDGVGNKSTLLAELYTYPNDYDEYLLIFKPSSIISELCDIKYTISEEIFDLIIEEIKRIRFYCCSMGLEIHGFETDLQSDRYLIQKNNPRFLNDSLFELMYISFDCEKNSYIVDPNVIEKYVKINLLDGVLFLKSYLVEYVK